MWVEKFLNPHFDFYIYNTFIKDYGPRICKPSKIRVGT